MNIRANIPDMNLIGVYSIINTVNGKRYVGSTAISFSARLGQHEVLLRAGKHTSRHLQSAWVKYGAESFQFCVEEICDASNVLIREQYFLDFYKSYNDEFGYNILPKAGSHLGAKRTDESKKKMGKWKRTAELGAKISEALKGRKLSQEHVEKMRGRKFSEETRAKMKAGHARARSNPEVIARMAAAQKGKKHSAEHIVNRVSKVIGKKHSPEWIEAIRRGNVGKKRSEESKSNIRAAQSKRIESLKKTVALRKMALALN